ncbi:MAG: glycosyltransferase [Myxococcota bacterium]|nr:glycosyltransferase [Myxococcota bacterium]
MLAKRLRWPVDSAHIVHQDRKILYKIHDTLFPIEPTTRKLHALLRHVPRTGSIFVFGVGAGVLVDRILARGTLDRVIVWDRDPWLVRLFLERRDYSSHLRSGRLVLKLGCTLISEREELRKIPMIGLPFFVGLYGREYHLLRVHKTKGIIFLCAGELFVKDIAQTLQRNGYTIYTWEVERLSHDEVVYAAMQSRPVAIVSINYRYGLSEVAASCGVPLYVWEIDPSMDKVRPVSFSVEKTYIYTWNRENIAKFQHAGFANVKHLPLATNPERCKTIVLSDEDRSRYGSTLAFVGASLRRQAIHYQSSFLDTYRKFCGKDGTQKLQCILNEQAKDYSQYRIPELILEYFPGLSVAFQGAHIDLAALVSEVAAHHKRLHRVRLLADRGLRVWGDFGWRQAESQYRGQADHIKEVVRIYNGALINIDINRIYQPNIVTMRVFDVLASGGFLLAEHSSDLETLFAVDEEIVSYRTEAELIQKVDHYLSHPEEREAIAARGQAKVLRDHTIQSRVRWMLEQISDRRGQDGAL